MLAATLYVNAIEYIEDDYAEYIISQIIMSGDDSGQIVLSEVFRSILSIDIEKIPNQIFSRVVRYCTSIQWSVASPYPDKNGQKPKPEDWKIIPKEKRKLKITQFGDGDFELIRLIQSRIHSLVLVMS